jgi:alkanesulfonate monooxygenase
MSGGRVDLGVGRAGSLASTRRTASPSPRTGERFDRLEETLAIVTGCGHPVRPTFSYDGDHYQ